MLKAQRVSIWIFLLGVLVACGNSNFEQAFQEATRSQNNTDSRSLELWRRSPTFDSRNFRINSNSNLDSIPLSRVQLPDLLSLTEGLGSRFLNVYRSFSAQNAPSFLDGLNSSYSRHSSEFKSFMAYAHLSQTINYMKKVFPDISFNGSGKHIFPLVTYAAQPGNSLNTQYLGRKGEGSIIFFQHDSNEASRFNPVDESDAIAHEFGHALQHALNLEVMENPGNYDMDMLLEALADLYAASYLRDPMILSYLESNAQYLFSASDRITDTHKRSLENSLSFPAAYLDHFHLDGRVVTGAFNDLRKFLEGDSIRLVNCRTSCSRVWRGQRLNRADAFDTVLRASHIPLRYMIPSSSLRSYFDRVLSQMLSDSSLLDKVCSSRNCRSEVSSVFAEILERRGLRDADGHIFSGPMRAGTTHSPNFDLTVTDQLGVMAFPGPLSGFSNDNGRVDPCELLFVFPNIKNNTNLSNRKSAFYDISFKVVGASGFFELPNIPSDRLYPESGSSSVDSSVKILGMLMPGEDSRTLVDSIPSDGEDYRLYTPQMGSPFTPFVSNSYFPSPLGWIVKAPRHPGATGSLRIRLTIRPLNAGYNNTTVRRTFEFNQSLTVNGSNSGFSCSS